MDKSSFRKEECRPRHERFIIGAMVIILSIVIGVVLWINFGSETETNVQKKFLSEPSTTITWPKVVGNFSLYKNLTIAIGHDNAVKITGIAASDSRGTSQNVFKDCTGTTVADICLIIDDDRKLVVKSSSMQIKSKNIDLTCYDVTWSALKCTNQGFTDCYDVTSARWYGGYADKVQNWPFEKNTRPMSAYVVNDSYIGEIGGVVERYFVSSNGIGIFVDENTPLYFSLNSPVPGKMCFRAAYEKYPYFTDAYSLPSLKYKLCQSTNVKSVHIGMSELFIDKPTGIPAEDLFKYPIWSTWAQYHKDINQSTVIEFASDILKYKFTHAQVEIDDDWTPAYGDMVFNTAKFPNATQMVKTLTDMGFKVTVWVHPFFNFDSKAFTEAATFSFLIRQYDSPLPALVPWWDGKLAGILDVSYETAINWYLAYLQQLRTVYNITSFKFDAGETSWIPHIFSANSMTMDPQDIYPKAYVKMANLSDSQHRIEVRAGYKTQKYPIFVRMMDKLSNWGHNNALKSVIPVVLTYGILGYPFVLPDMIGGNAYNRQPEAELYIRWLQLNTFLPSMQYSIVPWQYNNTIIDIARNFTELHENISDTLIRLAKESVTTGAPIIRPLWWIAPTDIVALECEDQFLVGDEYLVAPIVEDGARSRDIYFPTGSWIDMLRGGFIQAGWQKGYRVDIHELAYFRKQT